jgi:hypothetical protein
MISKITKADQIRGLALEGRSVAEIARLVGIKYQHARHVLNRSNMLPSANAPKAIRQRKPALEIEILLNAGFVQTAQWDKCETNGIRLSNPQPKHRGVYAFAIGHKVQYVGVASSGFANRLKFYCRPSVSQTTSTRLKKLIIAELGSDVVIDLYTATPPDSVWNGLLVDGCIGLEAGLIRSFDLPWNKRGMNPLL